MVDTLDGAARLCRMRNSQHCLMTYAISRLGGTDRYEAQVKKQTGVTVVHLRKPWQRAVGFSRTPL
ncbi:hypothetical protein JZ751_027607 [Albula glossodonta]|uniref:Uncharacterized protein n=1 Tax=Albula glossodonta TaxID=121402 RepID=A0A8T2NBR0_9TELE|nr:hypothetical protein JZ751_027607 [Albula glossodonta]